MSDMAERVARAIGQQIEGPAEDMDSKWYGKPLWQAYLTEAQAAIASMQADAAPVAWMSIETAPKDGTFILLHEILAQPPVSVGCYDHECGWLIAEADFMPSKCIPHHWMPLPAAPVDARVSTSNPVDDRQTRNTRDKPDTAPAVKSDTAPVSDTEDWHEAWRSVALLSSEHEDVRLNEAVAELHRAIEADRAAIIAAKDAEIAALKDAWQKQFDEKVKERDEAKLWFEKAQEWKQSLAALQAHADAMAGALGEVMEWIAGWTPDFTQDAEWPDTREKVSLALHTYEEFRR